MPFPLRNSRKPFWLAGLVVAAIASAGLYLGLQPRILFLGFPSMYRLLLSVSSQQSGVQYAY